VSNDRRLVDSVNTLKRPYRLRRLADGRTVRRLKKARCVVVDFKICRLSPAGRRQRTVEISATYDSHVPIHLLAVEMYRRLQRVE